MVLSLVQNGTHWNQKVDWTLESWFLYPRPHVSPVAPQSYSCVTLLVYMCHDSFIFETTRSCVTWLVHMCHDSFMFDATRSCVTWLVDMFHDSFVFDTTHSYVTRLIYTWHALFIHYPRQGIMYTREFNRWNFSKVTFPLIWLCRMW